MKFWEAFEPLSEKSVRMGAKDLAGVDTSNTLVGFEFEVAAIIDSDTVYEYVKYRTQYLEIDDWYESSFSDVGEFIHQYNATPQYGWANEDHSAVLDSDGIEVDLEDIHDFPTVEYLFHYDNQVFHDYDYAKEEDLRDQASQMDLEDQSTVFEIISDIFDRSFPYTLVNTSAKAESGVDYWRIVEDGSISPGGAEIVSPPLPADDAISALKTTLAFIRNDDVLYTNDTTGLHINVSVPDPEKIDLLKLSLLVGEDHILTAWERDDNNYARSVLDVFSTALEKMDVATVEDLIGRMNEFAHKNITHHNAIDFEKLQRGYLEFRMTGGEGYENREQDAIDLVKRYVRVIGLASDPMAEREAYLKKLYSFVQKEKTEDRPGISDSVLEKVLKDEKGVIFPPLPSKPLTDGHTLVRFFHDADYHHTPSKKTIMALKKLLSPTDRYVKWQLEKLADVNDVDWLRELVK